MFQAVQAPGQAAGGAAAAGLQVGYPTAYVRGGSGSGTTSRQRHYRLRPGPAPGPGPACNNPAVLRAAQVGCRLRNVGLLWVLLLTCSNILLTVRLLSSTTDCGPPGQGQGQAHPGGAGHGRAAPARASPQHLQARLQDADRAEPLAEQQDPLEQLPPEDDPDQQANVEEDADTISVELALGRWDSRRVVKMFDHALVGGRFAELSAEYKVTLATQTSLERLHSLVQVVHHWTGPVSVALYAAGDEWPLVQAYVRFLRRCYVPVRDRVTFHAAFPADRMPEPAAAPEQMTEILSLEAHLDCFRPEPSLKELIRQRRPETMRWRTRHGYPQNHLRNLARRACQVRDSASPPPARRRGRLRREELIGTLCRQTEFVFLVDVDVVPSLGLAQGLNEFLKKAPCGAGAAPAAPAVLPRPPRTGAGTGPRAAPRPGPPQCAYVIPTYELDERVRFPRNKSDLVRLAGKGLARPFHHKVFIYNQFATNFSRWQSEGDADGAPVHVAYNVTNFEFLYEPFYVARDTIPAHDERFMGYGYTRNTQARPRSTVPDSRPTRQGLPLASG
ncbi:Beta-1,4-glucuronyltransferase 1 [Frankliniella fusca]|uniref:Beta-1,4-glucuronyltransferase 1 n=1 Tax=Frankliniella fusca TaxID=407009 RepID=A0AAE1I306_9NEOP|nr:Beta-1,4-glucuronyltransferase 1 [Frankliniella fusca]